MKNPIEIKKSKFEWKESIIVVNKSKWKSFKTLTSNNAKDKAINKTGTTQKQPYCIKK